MTQEEGKGCSLSAGREWTRGGSLGVSFFVENVVTSKFSSWDLSKCWKW